MPYIGRAPTAPITKLEDADQDTKIQVEESSDEDIIRFDIAGAEDFTMTANTLTALSGSTIATNTISETTGASGVTIDGLLIKDSGIDLNGVELILDADGDTTIAADSDDQIDIKIAGADDFQFTANTFNILSGSTLDVNSGATIANSGTATGFGKLLQVQAAQSTSSATIVQDAGGQYAWGTTSLTCAITPAATTNKIHAIFSGVIGGGTDANGTGGTTVAIGLAGLDSGSGFGYTTAVSTAAFTLIHPHTFLYFYDFGDATGAWRTGATTHGLTVAGTVSEITYEVYIAPIYGSQATAYMGNAAGSTSNGPGKLILMEYAA